MANSSLLFHEPWWLAATTGGQISEVSASQAESGAGRLSFFVTRRFGFRLIRMPPFTHLLGPMIESGSGKYETRLAKRLSIVRALIDQLPPFDNFKHIIDPSLDDGLALADGLAFQDRGFKINTQYTFHIDCRLPVERLWADLHFKVRQHIRRAEEKYTVSSIEDPQHFVDFYESNLAKSNLVNYLPINFFPVLFAECQTRKCGKIIAALLPDGVPVAMTFVVWGNGAMYYLLSTRTPDVSDSGAVSLLIWHAIKQAHELGIIFDFDGIATAGIARFYAAFGGQIKTRLIATKSAAAYNALKNVRRIVSRSQNDTDFHT